MLLKRQDDIVQAASQDFGGRPAEETLALEIFPLVNEIRDACRNLKRWMAPRRAPVQWQFRPGKARVMYEPLGVVGILSSWNCPFFLSLAPLVGALAAGNHVLLKPSELAPACAELIESILSDLYPRECVSVIQGGPETAAEFARLPFDHLIFTGSTNIGRHVMRAAAENLVPVTLELGGKSPVIIERGYPLRKAAERILAGKLYNAGQTCVAPDYVLLPRGQSDDFVRMSQDVIARMHPSRTGGRDYTRIINTQHYRRLSDLVRHARDRGARVIPIHPGTENCDESNRVFPPMLVLNVRDDMAIMHEEVFGPVLPVLEYDSVDDAIAYVNARPHPLALYYFDTDKRRARDVIFRTAAGGITVNDCLLHAGQAALPFGGVGPSGMGRYHGFDGFQYVAPPGLETFSNKKSVFLQGAWSPLSILHPPYGRYTRGILRLMLSHLL